jgi:hypothetical protein
MEFCRVVRYRRHAIFGPEGYKADLDGSKERRGISSVLIEGGGHTLGGAFDQNMGDEVRFFIAPVIQGGTVPSVSGGRRGSRAPAIQLTDVIHKKIGSDVMVSGKVLRKQKDGFVSRLFSQS